MINSSVPNLLAKLCESLLSEKLQTEIIDAGLLKLLKSRSYEILLTRSLPQEDVDIEYELSARVFGAEEHKWKELNEFLDVIAKEEFFQSDLGRSFLQFLVYAGNTVETDSFRPLKTDLLVPGPFTLHSTDKNRQFTPEKLCPRIFSPPKYFKGLPTLKDADNPYLPKFVFEGEVNHLEKVRQKYAPMAVRRKKRRNSSNFTLDVRAFRFTLTDDDFEDDDIEFVLESPNSVEKEKVNKIEVKKDDRILSWSWSTLGQAGLVPPQPFVSELGGSSSLHVQAVYEKALGREYAPKIVAFDKFMRDLKSLTVGIQSETFTHDQFMIFHMQEGCTLADIMPEVMENYVSNFLECGTCYKRLKIMIMTNDYELRFEGFMFKALCSAIEEYLVTFRKFVYMQEDATTLDFYRRMRKMMTQISNLSCILGIHPDDTTTQLPLGSQFLGYIYKEIMRLTEKDLIMLLVFVLKKCCHVYFKHLQKWIFHGVLDDTCDELFVCFVDHYRPETKYFFDKAYFVRREFVPGFFQGFEDQLLQCGKYTMLLRAVKPNHPLFAIDCPSLSVCTSFEEISVMQASCRKYAEKAREICGKPITIRGVFEAQREKRNEFLKAVHEKSKALMDKWTAEQEELAEINQQQKKKRWEELTAHLKEVEDRKLADRRANIELELKILKEAEAMEDKRLLAENVNLRKRIEYYRELGETIGIGKPPTTPSLESLLGEDKKSVAKKASTTPISTAGTDFESCVDEDDTESVYDECISAELVEGFKEAEMDLLRIEQGGGGLKKSISDILNRNVEVDELTDAEKNRNRVMSGVNFGVCMQEEDSSNNNDQQKLLTEAQRIKMKILSQEYGIGAEADLNSNRIEAKAETELTDMQRNRKKMMENDTFAEFNKGTVLKPLSLDLTTERSRNRKKVLESEFNIITGAEATPMSTTSDILVMDKFDEVAPEPDKNSSWDFPRLEDTPEVALNTAGVLAKNGFDFTPKKSVQPEPSQLPAIPEAIVADFNAPYKRCEELLESNFKCQPKHAVFRLHQNSSLEEKSADKLESILKARKNQNSFSVITLTEFLRMSVVTPMEVHLEVISNEVMRVFLEDLDVLGHFESLCNYFFLMDGEFGSIICDGIIGKLENGATPTELLNFQTLHSILDSAVASSIMGNNKNAQNLSFIMPDLPEKFDLSSPSVLSNLNLSYRVDWPLNIILNPETIEQYANIFKYLVKVRRISWVLEQCYQMLKEIVKTNGREMMLSPQYKHVQLIRQKLFNFVNTLQNHITANALQASWKTFKDDLLSAKSIEDVYRKHTVYIKRILFLCMLNRKSLEFYNTIESIFKISLRFYNNLKSRQWKKKPGNEHFTHSRYEKLVADEVEFDKFIKYTIYLGNKIVRHGYQEEIGEFISFINYNSYYASE